MAERAAETKLGPYLDEWIERQASQLRPTAVRSYRQLITAYLRPHLGDHQLEGLDRRGLELFCARLLHCGGRKGGALSVRTVQYVHAVLHRALAHAVLDGLLEANPASRAQPPRHRPDVEELDDEHEVWDATQASRFLEAVDDHPWRAL